MNLLRTTAAAATVVVCALAPAAARAQAAGSLAPASTAAAAPDSAARLRGARVAQSVFEQVRFRNLPWAERQSGSGRDCDEVIGRFCMYKNEAQNDYTPPPDPPAVAQARDALLVTLAQAAAAQPGDGWVAGQRVRYLVEAERYDQAVTAAGECRAEAWWCAALEGYALHYAGRYGAADSAFTRALATMPAAVKAEWEDPALVLRGPDAREVRRMDPRARAVLMRRVWWLADPFWTLPGNDRKTEHYARLVATRFQDRARNVEGIYWADDLREILIRWGQPSGWSRIRPRPMDPGTVGLLTHYSPSFEFIPLLDMARLPYDMRAEEWRTDERSAYSVYAPPGVRRLNPLPFQLAAFRRGAQADVIAAFAMRPDSLPAQPVLDAGAALMNNEMSTPQIHLEKVNGTHGVLRFATQPKLTIASIETREPVTQRAARARFAADLTRPFGQGVAISDILLLERGDVRPRTLDEAAPLARGSTTFKAGDRLGLYWEVYGLGASRDSVTFSLALARRPPGSLQRAVEALGLGRTATPVRMRWEEEANPAPVLSRSLALAIPGVPAGDYIVEVSVRTRGGATASSVREITVVR